MTDEFDWEKYLNDIGKDYDEAQWNDTLDQLTDRISNFYNKLIDKGVPEDKAFLLTQEFAYEITNVYLYGVE